MSDNTWPINMPDFSEEYTAPQIVEEAPIPEEAPVIEPVPQIQCPDCERTFISHGGLGRHRQTAHSKVKKGKMHCPVEDCEAWFTPGSLGRHLRDVHKIFGGVSGVVRTRKPKKKTMEVAEVPTNGHKAEKLAPLNAEQITRAAAEALWPKGIPHDKLPSLLRWNIQTHYFLAEVQT